jgi:6-phosphogluconolactonase (cycloisomerase 2 family)
VALVLCAAAALLSPSSALARHQVAGAVYTETNQPNNQVVVFARGVNGALMRIQRVDTGGEGSLQNPPFPQDHLDAVNEVELTDNGRVLFAVNAGDDTVSSFRVGPKGRVKLVDLEPTGGSHPVSVDSHDGLLYVLNQLDQSGNDLSGFRYAADGTMTPIPNSSRALATPAAEDNGFGFQSPLASQVLFSPNGRVLTVPERTSNGFEGQLDTFAVRSDGTLGPVRANVSNAFIPFGMAWDNRGHLIVANGGSPLADPMFQGSGSSYSLSGTTLTAIDNESADALATCWVSIPESGKFAFMSNQNTEDISRFSIGSSGRLTLLGKTPTSGPGADTALSSDSRFLYVINVLDANGNDGATIDGYRVGSGGGLRHISTTDAGIPDSASGLASK